jgi:hypothetical protein
MAKLDGRTKGALWLLIGPTALLILTFMLYAIINLISAGVAEPAPVSSGTPDSLFAEDPAGTTAANIILFLFGALGVLTWLPGLIIGIVLLATKK